MVTVGLTAEKNPRIPRNSNKARQINILIYIQMKIQKEQYTV